LYRLWAARDRSIGRFCKQEWARWPCDLPEHAGWMNDDDGGLLSTREFQR